MRAVFALFVLCSVVLPRAAGGQELQDATLKELVLQAVRTHEAVQLANSQIRRAQADIKLVGSALLPSIDLNGAYTFFDDELSFELSPGERFVVRPSQDWSASIDLRQTLFYGLRDWRARDIARLYRDGSVSGSGTGAGLDGLDGLTASVTTLLLATRRRARRSRCTD